MESAALPRRSPVQYMAALEKAQRRKSEIAQLKREIKAGRLNAAEALKDPRASGAVTVGTILIAQPQWGRRRTANFVVSLGASTSLLTKRVEKLTERQLALLVAALLNPHLRGGNRDWW